MKLTYDEVIVDSIIIINSTNRVISGDWPEHNIRSSANSFFEKLQETPVSNLIGDMHDTFIDNLIKYIKIATQPGEHLGAPSRSSDVKRLKTLENVLLEQRKTIVNTIRG
ncbi:hypothetical protein ACPA0F_07995 [Solibacillus silvestris]